MSTMLKGMEAVREMSTLAKADRGRSRGWVTALPDTDAEGCERWDVAVHDKIFHADDVVSVALLAVFVKEDLAVVRTRDPHIISLAEVAVDVGGGEFDHHGTICAARNGEVFPGVPHCGCTLVAKALGLECFPRLMRELIAVAARDNGKQRPSGYEACVFDFVSMFNQTWCEATEEELTEDPAPEKDFLAATRVAIKVLRRIMTEEYTVLMTDKSLEELPKDRKIVKLPAAGMLGWKETFAPTAALLVIFPDTDGSGWFVQGVPVDPNKPECKAYLPQAWRGHNGAELDTLTAKEDLDGGVFVHNSGFLGKWKSEAQALLAAHVALREGNAEA